MSVSGRLPAYGQPKAQATGIADFERLTGLPLKGCLGDDHLFDIDKWRKSRSPRTDASTTWIEGAFYIDKNVKKLIELAQDVSSRISQDIAWLRPSGNIWGMTPDLGGSLTQFRAALVGIASSRVSNLQILFPKTASHPAITKRFQRLFHQGSIAATKLAPSLEILVIGDSVAGVAVHVKTDDRETTPIGIVTAEAKLIRRLKGSLSAGDTIWSNPLREKVSTIK